MTAALSVVPYYFATDCDHDISADVISLSTDKINWVTATAGAPSAALQAYALAQQAVPTGFTRYWVSVPTGPGTPGAILSLNQGIGHIHGRIVDGSNTIYLLFRVVVPSE